MRKTVAGLFLVLGLGACGSEVPSTTKPVPTTTTVAPTPTPVPTPTVTTVPSRKPHYVIVDKGGPVPNIEPPTKLYVRGLTETECADWGGTFDGSTGMCRNVDY